MKRIILIILSIHCTLFVISQELKVKEFRVDETDISAVKFQIKDFGGEACALVKVGLAIPDASFEGDIVKTEYKDGEYWVYLTNGATWLNIKSNKYLPLRYEFEGIKSKLTYIMQIEKPVMALEGPIGIIHITSNVKNADVYVDGEKLSSVTPFQYKGSEGEHIIELKASGYNDEKSVVNVKLNQKLNHNIIMRYEGSFAINGISYEMIHVPAGTFFMGSMMKNDKKNTFNYEQPIHQVSLKSYSIGKTEVTQALWEEIMGSNPSINQGPNLPVENVTWHDCKEFISKLNARCSTNFRLPTEAEWEFAARGAGREEADSYSGDTQIDKVSNIGTSTIEVGSKKANTLNIQDMSGNVAEWCEDWLGKYTSAKQVNPVGPLNGVRKIIRGGSCKDEQWYHRNSCRSHEKPRESNPYTGLRLAND